jgi:hypothetical protein
MNINKLRFLLTAILCFFIHLWLEAQCMELTINNELVKNYKTLSENKTLTTTLWRTQLITHDLNENSECCPFIYCCAPEKIIPQKGDSAICSNSCLKIKGVESKNHIEYEQHYCHYSGIYESDNSLKVIHPHADWCLVEEPSWYRCLGELLCSQF